MKIYKVTDPEFRPYGRVIEGCQTGEILKVLEEQTPLPEGTVYVADFDPIRSLEEAKRLSITLFGGVPAQFGFCNGHNTKLNCLEYHRCSEFNLGTEDFIIEPGDRIAQLVLNEIPQINWILVESKDDLSSTDRGLGGFGSTGK